MTPRANIIPTSGGLLYLPAGTDFSRKYPLIVALSPDANAQSMIQTWEGVASRHHWLVYGSLESRNGMDMEQTVNMLERRVNEVAATFPVDRARIVSTGFSGGAMLSHAFAFYKPALIAGIVANTGMMHSVFRDQPSRFPHGKFVAFLASPTDFRYGEMQRDRCFLQGLGWKTLWLEFSGGHTIGPRDSYEKAAAWIGRNLKAAGGGPTPRPRR